VLGGEVVDLVRLSGGASRETWAFDLVPAAAGRRRALILQRRRAGAGPQGHSPGIEAQLLRAAASWGVPVPGLVAEGDGETDGVGAPWLVVDRVEGETIPRKLLRDDEFAEARRRLPAQCGRAAAALHAIPVDDLPDGLDDQDQLDAFGSLVGVLDPPRPALELGLRRLAATRPAAGATRRTLVHGDLRTGNLLVGPDGLRAVLDWELAHIGDPIEDLGWFCLRSWRFGSPHRAGGFGPVEDLVDAYQSEAGVKVDLDALCWWEAFGALKWAVICLLQAGVHLSGVSRSVELAAIGRRAYESEWDLLELLGALPPDDDPPPRATGPLTDAHPGADHLLEAVREFLVGDVMDQTTGRLRFHARVAGKALAVVERELVLGPAVAAAHDRRLDALGFARETDLVDAIRAGQVDDRWTEVAPAVAASVRDQLLIANPAWLDR
jgi:aminoglycoside phosphotransferase (APT) family kinase protein